MKVEDEKGSIGIVINSMETNSYLDSVTNRHVAIMHQPVSVS